MYLKDRFDWRNIVIVQLLFFRRHLCRVHVPVIKFLLLLVEKINLSSHCNLMSVQTTEYFYSPDITSRYIDVAVLPRGGYFLAHDANVKRSAYCNGYCNLPETFDTVLLHGKLFSGKYEYAERANPYLKMELCFIGSFT